MSRTLSVQPFTILSGQSVSNELDMRMWRLIGIEMPAGWDAAGLSFKSGSASGAEVPFTDTAGAEVTFTVSAAKYIAVSDTNNAYRALAIVKLVSGTNAVPVPQTANRVINAMVIPLD